jgi:general stress protein 26
MPETAASIAKLNELIQGINIAILTTVRPDGSLHSCPMAAHAADEQGVLWFLADNRSEKVEAVRTNQRVSVAYADHSAQRYISVSGFCELVRDHARGTQLWKPSYKDWFSGGVDDPALVLLKVDIQQAEYWDASKARMLPLVGFPGIV